jgi:hypothetical protein
VPHWFGHTRKHGEPLHYGAAPLLKLQDLFERLLEVLIASDLLGE